MTKNIDQKKLDLIKQIADINSVLDIEQLEKQVKLMKMKEKHQHIFKDLKENMTVEQLKQEQNFKGIDRKEFDNLVHQLDIQEPFEELLLMLD